MDNITIKHRRTGETIYDGPRSGLHGANLRDANLYGAGLHGENLRGANLCGANLCGADLHGADLRDANLHGADLHGADLRGANLHGANLHGADLHGADLRGATIDDGSKLIGPRPVFMLGPIGSEQRTLVAYSTDNGIRLRAGCFFGDVPAFLAALKETHDDNEHAHEYRAALALIEAHHNIWATEE